MRSATIIDGKSLKRIAEENGLSYDCVLHRFCRGDKTYERLARPTSHMTNVERLKYSPPCMGNSKRLLDAININDINLSEMSRKTGVKRSTIYAFIYNGTDISSMKLAKLCGYIGVSMDYVMGLKESKRL